MNSPKKPANDALNLINALDRLGTNDPALVNLLTDIFSDNIEQAAVKMHRLWNWTNTLLKFPVTFGFDFATRTELQALFIEHGFSPVFFSALDIAVGKANRTLPKDEKVTISYEELSQLFHNVLKAVLQKFPRVSLGEEEIAHLELEYLSGHNHDETNLLKKLTSNLNNHKLKN